VRNVPLPEFDYIRPKSVEELTSILAKHGSEAKLMAGGTDLLVLMRDRLVRPRYVVDIKGIGELQELSWDEGQGLTIGATVTMNEIIASDIIRERFGALWSAASDLADPTVRSRATLVGNICNASPAADTAPALLVHDGEVETVSAKGSRKIPIEDFFKGVKRTALGPDEFVKAVHLPNPPNGAKSWYLKWKRTWGEDLALVGVAALVANPRKWIVRVALSSVAPTPVLVPEVQNAFEDDGTLEEKIEKAAASIPRGICPITDVRCNAEYRTHIAIILTKRVLRKLLELS
jgi:carbon-monoxide dehydrogenase medium subunit